MNKEIDQDDPFGPFNFSDFKKWMQKSQDDSANKMTGIHVESKISARKLISKIEVQEGEIEDITQEFAENGGTIKETNGHFFLIEVNSGLFLIERNYVSR